MRAGLGARKTGRTLQDCVRSYIFVTHVGLRPAEPCSISVVATHQLLTQILLYTMYYIRHFDVRRTATASRLGRPAASGRMRRDSDSATSASAERITRVRAPPRRAEGRA